MYDHMMDLSFSEGKLEMPNWKFQLFFFKIKVEHNKCPSRNYTPNTRKQFDPVVKDNFNMQNEGWVFCTCVLERKCIDPVCVYIVFK